MILSVNHLTKTYGVEPILSDISFHVNEGDRIGIIGVNGAGKTTLMNILSGALPYDSGDIFMPKQLGIGYLRQSDNFQSDHTVYQEMLSIFNDLLEMESEIERFSHEISERSARGEDVDRQLHQLDDLTEKFKNRNGYGYRSEILGILNSMAFPEAYFDKKISLLSGGERTRLALAALLLQKPELLFLDEPTNHLDIGTLKWLEQYLKTYSGTIILISHDRYFLDQTVNRIFEIEHHELFTYEGNYSTYTEQKSRRREEAVRKYETQQKEIQRQEEIIRRFKQHGTEKLAKRAASREKRLSAVEVMDRPQGTQRRMKINFKQNFQSGGDVLHVKDLAKSFPSGEGRRQLFRDVELDVKRGERICLVGANGIGKTTLLKILLGEEEADQGSIKRGHHVVFGYYDQGQQLLDIKKTVLDEVHDAYRLYTDTEVRSLLGRFLFKNDMVFQQISSLSGGERARLALLKLMLSGSNLLLMDEPTNHLDLASKEVFEEALLDYPGTLIVVSHDRYFLNRIPTRIVELSEDGISVFLGGYDYYMEKKQSLGSGKRYLDEMAKKTDVTSAEAKAAGETAEEVLSPEETRRRNKELQAAEKRKEREQSRLESVIAEREQKIIEIEEEMCKEEVYLDHEKSHSLQKELDETKEVLSEAYQAWMLLQEENEKN